MNQPTESSHLLRTNLKVLPQSRVSHEGVELSLIHI